MPRYSSCKIALHTNMPFYQKPKGLASRKRIFKKLEENRMFTMGNIARASTTYYITREK